MHGGKRINAGRPKGQGKFGSATKAVRVPENLVDDVNDYALHNGYKIPFFDVTVQAGYATPVEDNLARNITVNALIDCNYKNCFCTRVAGISMIDAGIYEGDIVIIDKNLPHTLGKIVLAYIEGEGATLKRLDKINNKLCLIPENKFYQVIPIEDNNIQCHIYGVVVGLVRNL
jgi:DNA polymerase V